MKKWVGLLVTMFIILTMNIKSVNALITIEPKEVTLGIGYTQKINVSGNVNDVRMTSGNTNVAYINDDSIYANGIGTAYITVSDGFSTAVCKVIVVDNFIPVSSISLSKSSETLTLKSKSQINVSIYPANATNRTIRYTSNNESIASVNSDGIVTANKVGKTYITVTVDNKTQIYNVTVINSIALKSISIPSALTIKEGATNKINVTYNPSNATNKVVTWRSSNNRVVTVDGNGNIKGISTGSATITATSNDGKHVATSNITVVAATTNNNNTNTNNNNNNSNNNENDNDTTSSTLKEIKLNKTELNMKMGDETTLTVEFNPSNFENKKVKWTSTNDEIAFVDDSGKIKALKPGRATIKVTSEDGNKEAKCTVTVTSGPIKSISFADEEITVYVDSKTALETISDPENTAIENPTWTSSDEDVATVEDGVVNAKKVGTTTITVSNKAGDISASINIIVEEKKEEKLLITIEGYDLNFDVDKLNYTLLIGNESELDIKVNRDNGTYAIGGNRDLKNGSIITIKIKDKKSTTYVINIKKKQNYTIYFIAFISVLLFINIIRLLNKNKKKK